MSSCVSFRRHSGSGTIQVLNLVQLYVPVLVWRGWVEWEMRQMRESTDERVIEPSARAAPTQPQHYRNRNRRISELKRMSWNMIWNSGAIYFTQGIPIPNDWTVISGITVTHSVILVVIQISTNKVHRRRPVKKIRRGAALGSHCVLGAAVLSNKSCNKYFLKLPWQLAFCIHSAPWDFPVKTHQPCVRTHCGFRWSQLLHGDTVSSFYSKFSNIVF
jgi:hypothetical protein